MYGLLTQNYSLSKRHITMHSDNVHHIELENQQKQKTKQTFVRL